MEKWINFIKTTSIQFFKVDDFWDEENLQSFVLNENIPALTAFMQNNKLRFDFKNLPQESCLLFYKTNQFQRFKETSLGLLTLQSDMDTEVRNTITEAFFHSGESGANEKLKSILGNLRTTLGIDVGLPAKEINSVDDEIKFWNEKTSISHAAYDQSQVESFTTTLEKMNNAIRRIGDNSSTAIEELLDSCHNHLDELWRLPYHYPQNRMADLIDATCNQIIQTYIQKHLQDDIWDLNSDNLYNIVGQIFDFVESWINLCDSLTRLIWPNYSIHPWNGEPHKPVRALAFKDRLSEIKNLTKVYKQVVRLLGDHDLGSSFTWTLPMKAVSIFDISSSGQRVWTKAVHQFELMLQPIEEKMCSAIKSQIYRNVQNPRQILYILSKYDTIIWRPTFKEVLGTEEDLILQSLRTVTQNLKTSLSDINMESEDSNVSAICTECKWLRVIRYQLEDLERVSRLFDDREDFQATRFIITELQKEVEGLLRGYFESWRDQSLSWIKSMGKSLFDGQPVVEFQKDTEQYMFVNFDSKFVSFCQEVKEFEIFGFRIPTELMLVATNVSKFISHARSLHQIANFHNTIVSRMIPCQRPIMLKAALELSKLVHSESVYWNDEKSVKSYILKLQKQVNKLSNDNTKLVGYHEHIKQKVVKLMNADLITQSQIWKDEIHHLREIFLNLERAGYTNLETFKLHWDYQLYKVLESQYILGLADVNSKLPDIFIDIMFRESNLVFRPCEEEIRHKYYTQLQKLIVRPLMFRGFSENNGDLFKIMVERNMHHLDGLYRRAEETMETIEKLKSLWLPWIALGCIDIEEMCRVHLQKKRHWDANFKTCKRISQQIAKISMSENHLDCFVINIQPLKASIENLIRFYWDTLATSLRNSIVSDVTDIQEYINSSLQFLQDFSSEKLEIMDTGPRYQQIVSDYGKFSKVLHEVQKKDTCLGGWCKERISSLTSVVSQWEKLKTMIEDHSIVMERQVEIVKENLSREISGAKDEIENFLIRWDTTIADIENSDSFTSNSLDLLKERILQWNSLKEKTERMRRDGSKFDVEFPEEATKAFICADEKVIAEGKQWETCEGFFTELDQTIGEYWAVYCRRPYILTEFLVKWEKFSNSNADLSAGKIKCIVDKYKNVLPILQSLQTEALTERHWNTIFETLKIKPIKVPEIRIQDVLKNVELLEQNDGQIKTIVRQATLEQVVRQVLNELEIWSSSCSIKLVPHTDSTGNSISLTKELQEVINKIRENQSLLQSAKNTASFDIFSEQADIWEKRLKSLDNILTCLNHCQRKWVYLEPVFCGGALKSDEVVFKRIDKDFRYLIKEIESDPKVLSILKINNIYAVMNSLENQLAQCQRSLISFLANKRNSFPRFYFLGNDDLLELLGQSTKEEIIQKHIKKVFPGIATLGIENANDVKRVISSNGDVVQLDNAVHITNNIESWLKELQGSVRETLKRQIQNCAKTADWDVKLVSAYPEQVLCTARSVHFTKQCERAITTMTLPNLLRSLQDEMKSYNAYKSQNKDVLVDIKIKSYLLDLVHHINVVESLIKENVTSQDDWNWLEQIRLYVDANGMVIIKMGIADFQYSYEFLGNASKLVQTKLTHKCYLTLTQAIALGYGGNLFGPAGTGKTECVKSLGSKLGRLVLVFNCDENLNIDAMKRIITGLAKCGAWGCFDEFNRLQETTLSTISTFIKPVQLGLKSKAATVKICDENVDLDLHCGIFVTLNPSDEDYGGRQQLPRNIQTLFRPIVMEQPNPYEIANVLLFVEGFEKNKLMADRIVELFELAPKVLSKQIYYDWGLREIKTILLACGKFLNEEGSNGSDEMCIALKALRSNMISKITSADLPRFQMLLDSVFTESKEDVKDTSNFQQTLRDSFASLGLKANDKQVAKCIQLKEQLTRRMGVILVGPATCGKSTIISVLKHALTANGQTIRSYTMNPKAMTRSQLLGTLDPDTKQWIDGVLTSTAYAASSEPENVTSWIVCDGEIDPEWIEALNSVFDDNRLLTLPSGWRISFSNNINFIFETHDLVHASPATISRMGIVNLSTHDLDETSVLDVFLSRTNDNGLLESCIQQYFLTALTWFGEDFSDSVGTPHLSKIINTLNLVKKSKTKEEFCVRTARALYGYIPTIQHNKFANKLYELADVYITEPSKAEYAYYSAIRNDVRLYEFDSNYQPSSEAGSNLILTAQIQTCLEIMRDLLQTDNAPFIVVGPAGCAKTMSLQRVVAEFPGNQLIVVNCSSQITPAYILHVLKQNCVAVSGIHGRELRPQQQRTVLYLKNVDMCHIDSWGTSSVIELLLQLIQRRGLYSDSLEWVGVVGLQICASMDESSRGKLSPRYLALNEYVRFKYPSNEEIICIIKNQLEQITTRFVGNINKDRLAVDLLQFFDKICQNFTHAKYIHYNFNPKMLTNVIENLKFYPENYFNEAVIDEIKTTLRNRLCTKEDIEAFDQILAGHLEYLQPSDHMNKIFVPTIPTSTQVDTIAHDDWKDVVEKHRTICSTESMMISTPAADELIKLTSQIVKVLSRTESHVTFIGPSGARHTEATHIAVSVLDAKLCFPMGSQTYRLADFYNDLKKAVQSAAMDNRRTIFLLDHYWLSFMPDILKPIEAILQGSEVIDLFGEELESIANSLKDDAMIDGYQGSLASYFLERARSNLHLVLNLTNSSENLYQILNRCPAIYKNSQIIWTLEPSSPDLTSLPNMIIDTFNTDKIDVPIPSYFGAIINSCPENGSRKRFDNLIKCYFHIFTSQFKEVEQHLKKLSSGIAKLSSTHEEVHDLKQKAVQQEAALAEKRKLASDALEMITSTMRNANNQKTELLELKRKTQESSTQLKERQKVIEIELRKVEPLLQEASAAVSEIKMEALSEIRSLRAPPEIIRDILEGVLRLMGVRDTSWNSMKSFLAKRGVKEDIRLLDPAKINTENREAVEKLLRSKPDSFDMRNAKRASAAAAPLAGWVMACVQYSRVIEGVKPLEKEKNVLEKDIKTTEEQVNLLMDGLNDVDSQVKGLSEQLNVYTQEALALEIKLDEASTTLNKAKVLVEKLGEEYESWKVQLHDSQQTLETLESKSSLIALCINYLSSLTTEERSQKLDSVTSTIKSVPFSLIKSLTTEEDQVVWESMGLPRDMESLENAALLIEILKLPFATCSIPLVLDPLNVAITWLQEYLKTNTKSFEVISQNSEKFSYNLELAARFGKIVIIIDCDSVQMPLLEIIPLNISSKYNEKSLRIGNKLIPLHESFRIVLFTNLIAPEIGKETISMLSIIPFKITTRGFTGQLLLEAIKLKQPALEERRKQLLETESKLLKDRAVLQDKLLEELSSASGNILNNDALSKTLNEVKESSVQIDNSLWEGLKVKESLMLEYSQFNNICEKAAQLYTGLTEAYDLTATSFKKLFMQSLDTMQDQSDEKKYGYLVRLVYKSVCRSIPRKDHLALGLFMCRKGFSEMISEKKWELFVTNFAMSEEIPDHSSLAWISSEARNKVLAIKAHLPDTFNCLQLDNELLWKNYVTGKGDKSQLPVEADAFEKVMLAQVFRRDLAVDVMYSLVREVMNVSVKMFTQPTIKQLFEETHASQPIVLVIKSSLDLSDLLRENAYRILGNDSMYMELSVGSSSLKFCLNELRSAADSGRWLCLKDAHFATEWLHNIESEFDAIKSACSTFRLWMISDSIDMFPKTFAQRSVKIILESPVGMKNNLIYRMQQCPSYIAQTNDSKIAKLYAVEIILDTILQARRNYIPQGWSKIYEFGNADFNAALHLTKQLSDNGRSYEIDWKVIKVLFENLIYGGHMNNNRDLDILRVYLNEFLNENIYKHDWKPLGWKIPIPTQRKFQDYGEIFQKLPDEDVQENFGLVTASSNHGNFDFAEKTIKTLKSFYVKNEQKYSIEKRIKPVFSLWKKLTQNTTVIQTYKNMSHSTLKSDDPWNTFLVSEMCVAGLLFKNIHESLTLIHSTLKDTKQKWKQNNNLINTLADNLVPSSWRKLWRGPKNLSEYLKSAVCRGLEAERRYRNIQGNNFQSEINFSTIFSPASFLTFLKIAVSYKIKQPISNLTLVSSIDKLQGEIVVKILPLTIDGGYFTNDLLTVVKDPIDSRTISPEFYITYIPKEAFEKQKHYAFDLPVYTTRQRETFLCNFTVKTKEDVRTALLSGAALIIPSYVENS